MRDAQDIFTPPRNPMAGNGRWVSVKDALYAKLSAALASVNRGNRSAARGQLTAFVNQVGDLVGAGRLPAADGQALVNAAQIIINLLA